MAHVIGTNQPTGEKMKHTPYLKAVVQETLRLYPAAYALFCRKATENVSLGDIIIKKGELVQLLPYITHRDARWFPEPLSFKPERFMEKLESPHYAYFPFGAGPRVCIGASFGIMELMLCVTTILQKYTPRLYGKAPVGHPQFSLRPQKGFLMEFVMR